MVDINKVCALLKSDSFRELSQKTSRRKLIEMANELGPEMVLIHSQKLEELGRIPRYSENFWIKATEAIDVYKAAYVEVFMFSHRWLRASKDPQLAHPDSETNEKAFALAEFSKWRRKWVEEQHGFTPQILYWIDYSCFHEGRMDEYFPMLPLWVACCERFLSFSTPDYKERCWCRLEELLSFTFSFADHHTIIDKDFRFKWPYTGNPQQNILEDPRAGHITNQDDHKYVSLLTTLSLECAELHKNKGNSLSPASFGKAKIKSFML